MLVKSFQLFGEKSFFAVEYKIENKELTYGFARIWFKNEFIGTNEDIIPIKGYVVTGLKDLLNVPFLSPKILKNSRNIYEYFESRINLVYDEDIDKHQVSFGTFCDNFLIFAFRMEDEITVTWKLISNNEELIFDDLKIYPRDCFAKTFKYTSLKERIDAFDLLINQIGS